MGHVIGAPFRRLPLSLDPAEDVDLAARGLDFDRLGVRVLPGDGVAAAELRNCSIPGRTMATTRHGGMSFAWGLRERKSGATLNSIRAAVVW